MFRFSSLFLVLALAVVSYASPLKRTVQQIEADIATISTQTTKLDSDINAFPNSGGSLIAALGIHTDATNLQSSLNQGATDATATAPPSEADSQTILDSIQAVVPTIVDALNAIVEKKPAFQSLPLGGVPALVRQDLTNLNASTTAFENALIAITPADLVDDATALKNTVDAAFATALAAYADV